MGLSDEELDQEDDEEEDDAPRRRRPSRMTPVGPRSVSLWGVVGRLRTRLRARLDLRRRRGID